MCEREWSADSEMNAFVGNNTRAHTTIWQLKAEEANERTDMFTHFASDASFFGHID